MNNKLAELLSVMILSLAFQLALHGYAGDDRAVPPDAPLFLSLAVQIEAALNGTGKLEGHVTRTPGYPALLYVAGRSASSAGSGSTEARSLRPVGVSASSHPAASEQEHAGPK